MAYNDGIGGIGLRQTEVTLPTQILILNVDHTSGDTRCGLCSGFVEVPQQEITVESASNGDVSVTANSAQDFRCGPGECAYSSDRCLIALVLLRTRVLLASVRRGGLVDGRGFVG